MKDLATYIRAGFAALYAVTHEEERIAGEIKAMAKTLGYTYWTWTCTEGLKNHDDNKVFEKTVEPLAALTAFVATEMKGKVRHGTTVGNKSIVLMLDFHLFLKTVNPVVVRRLKEAIIAGRSTNRHLIIMGCQLHLPPELEKEVTVVEFPLPTREELEVVANQIAKHAKLEVNGSRDKILDAGSGLTTQEFADASSFAVIETKEMSPAVISRIKAETIKKNGILEIVTQVVTLDDIGGLEFLKADLYSKRNSFTKQAKEYGLPSPRPLLCVGQAGTGKSLTATAAGTVFGLPLLRLEAGRLFGSLVGESERNWRTAFATAKAVAPCVVWIDEVDGLFSGGESSGRTDGGTTSRVIKAVLQDLQYNADGLFFVFTANDIDNLPDPLIDRCEVWSVDLPTYDERVAIWRIHITKRKRKPEVYGVGVFAEQSEGFSGRQIEQAWLKSMTDGFNDGCREPTDEDVVAVLKSFVPTSVTMKDAIERRRERLKDRARPASRPQAELPMDTSRKLG